MANGSIAFEDKKLIIWDWNGTLLNDTAVSIESMNRMLARRGMSLLDEFHYKRIFRFPVRDYYIDLGFDFSVEHYETLSVEFISNYRALQHNAGLHDGVQELLSLFRAKGITQVILWAMERLTLISDVTLRGIGDYFLTILGPEDHLAQGKTEIATNFLKTLNIAPKNILMIGDTVHDFEVSGLIGCECILVAQGHHPFEKLISTGTCVQKNLADVFNLPINP